MDANVKVGITECGEMYSKSNIMKKRAFICTSCRFLSHWVVNWAPNRVGMLE